MLTLVHRLSALSVQAHAAVGDDVDFQSCFYFSLLGLIVSLAFLHLSGPAGFIMLASAG